MSLPSAHGSQFISPWICEPSVLWCGYHPRRDLREMPRHEVNILAPQHSNTLNALVIVDVHLESDAKCIPTTHNRYRQYMTSAAVSRQTVDIHKQQNNGIFRTSNQSRTATRKSIIHPLRQDRYIATARVYTNQPPFRPCDDAVTSTPGSSV